jgi:hypothetical protein
LGASRTFPKVLGADTATFNGEFALKTVHDLPDPTVRRYGRPDVYGAGPVNGVCLANAPDVAKQCSSDGFVSKRAYGYRVGASLRYPSARSGVDLTPSAVFTHDLKGWSYDGVFSEGRQSLTLGLSAVISKQYFASIVYSGFWGGRYSVAKDKDTLSLSVGASF